MNEELQELLAAQFEKWPQAVAEPVPDAEILVAEASLGVMLPDDYRDFVRCYGGAVVRSVSVLGLRRCEFCDDEQSTFPEQTARFRLELPDEYSEMVVISVDDAGNPIGFLNGKPPIFVFDFNFGGRYDLARSFSEYVRLALSGELDI